MFQIWKHSYNIVILLPALYHIYFSPFIMRFTRYLLQVKPQEILVKAASGNPTGLTGIFQHPNPRPALIALYNATLDKLKKDFPQESVYRTSVETFTQKRLEIVETTDVVEQIEAKIGAGLIEEVIIQANEELELATKMAEWKPWEELEEKPLDDQWIYFGKKI